MFGRRQNRYEGGSQLKRIRKKNLIILVLISMTTYVLYRALFGSSEDESQKVTMERMRREYDHQLAVIRASKQYVGEVKDGPIVLPDMEGKRTKGGGDQSKLPTAKSNMEMRSENVSRLDHMLDKNVIGNSTGSVKGKLSMKTKSNGSSPEDNKVENKRDANATKQRKSKQGLHWNQTDTETAPNATISKQKHSYNKKRVNEIKDSGATRKEIHNSTISVQESIRKHTDVSNKTQKFPKKESLGTFELLSKLNTSQTKLVPKSNAISLFRDDGIGILSECVNLHVRGGSKEDKSSAKVCIYNTTEDSIISKQVKQWNTWEQGDLDSMGGILRKQRKMMLIDIGCNIGIYTVYAATIGSRVISIDPFKDHLKQLHKSLKLNNRSHAVTMLWNAVSRDHRLVNLSQGQENNKGAININFDRPTRPASNYSVQTIILDDLIDEFQLQNKSVFLKLDIEGSEYKALMGGVNFFRRVNVCYVLMEFVTYKYNNKGGEIIEFMKHFGLYPYSDLNLEVQLDKARTPLKNYPLNTVFAKDTLECLNGDLQYAKVPNRDEQSKLSMAT